MFSPILFILILHTSLLNYISYFSQSASKSRAIIFQILYFFNSKMFKKIMSLPHSSICIYPCSQILCNIYLHDCVTIYLLQRFFKSNFVQFNSWKTAQSSIEPKAVYEGHLQGCILAIKFLDGFNINMS